MLPVRKQRGIRLLFQKAPAIDLPTADWTDISQVLLPYTYFSDTEVPPAVSLYDTVRRGTPLAVSEDPVIPVLSSVTGVVSGEREVSHPLYGVLPCAVIDRLSVEPEPEMPVPLTESYTADDIVKAAEDAHIIDEIDGVPLSQKLRDWNRTGCDIAVADAVQIQPFESSAWAVLRDHAEQVVKGLELAAQAAGSRRYHIAVCLSGQRRRSLALRVGKRHLYQTDSYYPVCNVARRTSGRAARLFRIGVQACLALYRALYFHEPHDRCVVTVAGDAIAHPQNVCVPFGTPVQELLQRCGVTEEPACLILGEIMTGTAAATQDIPVLPGMTCLLAFTAATVQHHQNKTPHTCIGCGRCVQVCHADLLPFEIARRFRNMHYERLGALDTAACDGCGACSYVCPSGIDLTSIIADARSNDSTILLDWEEETDA